METTDFIFEGPANPRQVVILAHGAGQGMATPFLDGFAHAIARTSHDSTGVQVVRFEFPYMRDQTRSGRKKPPDREPVLIAEWLKAIESIERLGCPRARMVIGGKSMGGRIASLIADQAMVAGLICLGYPFHPPGRPERLRTAHLGDLRTPALICQGTRDPFGTRQEVENYRLSKSIRLCWLEDGDHNFKPRKSSGLSLENNWRHATGQIRAFLATLARGH